MAVIVFWWEDWPGSRLRLGWPGLTIRPVRTPLTGQHAVDLRSIVARLHQAFNDRDLGAWSEVFDEDVELVVDGAAFRGVAAARAYVTAVFRELPRPAHPRRTHRRRVRRHDRGRARRSV